MRLSEAMILGSTLSEQCFGIAEDGDKRCALSAAGDATNTKYGVEPLCERWPWLKAATHVTCPDCGTCSSEILFMIACHLNDFHRWPRERIAEWVATIEPQETAEEKREIVEQFCEQIVEQR